MISILEYCSESYKKYKQKTLHFEYIENWSLFHRQPVLNFTFYKFYIDNRYSAQTMFSRLLTLKIKTS